MAPTRFLAQQIKNRLDKTLVKHGQGKNVHLIITDEHQNLGGVIPRFIMLVKRRKFNENHTLIITTEAFRRLLPIMNNKEKTSYNVFLDEGIDAVDQVKINTENQHFYLDLLSFNDDGTISIAKGKNEIIKTVAKSSKALGEIGRDELAAPKFIQLATILASGIYDVYGTKTNKSIQVVGFLNPSTFMPFDSVTIVMAIFEQSLLSLFWQKKYGIKFQKFNTNHELYDTHMMKGHLIKISHILHPNDKASKYNLERDWETGKPNAREMNNRRVIDQAAIQIGNKFNEIPYCWAANSSFENVGQKLEENNKMPAKCAGLNNYKHFDTVVSMVCINPEPWLKTMITNHIDIVDEELYELWKLAYTYQAIGRCSLRNRNSNNEIHIVVISLNCAKQIQHLFKDSKIEGQITNLPSYEANVKRRGKAKNPNNYQNKDYVAWHRFQKKNPKSKMTMKGWYEKYRI